MNKLELLLQKLEVLDELQLILAPRRLLTESNPKFWNMNRELSKVGQKESSPEEKELTLDNSIGRNCGLGAQIMGISLDLDRCRIYYGISMVHHGQSFDRKLALSG